MSCHFTYTAVAFMIAAWVGKDDETLLPMRILTLCGSLRARSSNRAVLNAFARLVPAGVRLDHFDRLGSLPHFNPDADTEPLPPEVSSLRSLVAHADVLVLSTPEYVHALPGSFKNALDWLVSDPTFAGKPVAILQVARGSSWALDSLREVLATMSARIIEPAVVMLPLGGSQIDEDVILRREDLRASLEGAVVAVVADSVERGGVSTPPPKPQ
jgi:NAD(P)H-dependent FMN reductase